MTGGIAGMLAALPPEITDAERERWIAVFTTVGVQGWPGTCTRARCVQPVAADDVCMTHWCDDWRAGDRRGRKVG